MSNLPPMSAPEQRQEAVLLPHPSPGGGRAAGLLSSLSPVSRVPDDLTGGELVVVDLSAPGGAAALDRVCPAGQRSLCEVIAVVDVEDAETLALARTRDVAEVIDLRAGPAELRLRIDRLQRFVGVRREQDRRQRELARLVRLTAGYANAADAPELLHDVTRWLAEELGILRASLVVFAPDGRATVVAASDDPSVRDLPLELARYPEVREVLKTGKPLVLADAPSHPLLAEVHELVAQRNIGAIAVVPLGLKRDPAGLPGEPDRPGLEGVLFVRASRERDGFTPGDLELLEGVADATAVALGQLRLHRSERERMAAETSARVAAEERAEQLSIYETYFAHLSEGVAVLDRAARVTFLNPAACRMLETTSDEVRGRQLDEVSGIDHEVLMNLLWRLAHDGGSTELDVACRLPSGATSTLSVSAAPLDEGELRAILCLRDVTEQRRTADELRQTKDFLERLIDSSVDAIIAADLTGTIILFNKGAEKILGRSAKDVVGRVNVRGLYAEGTARTVMARLRKPTEGGVGRLELTREELLDVNGERVPVNMTAAIISEGAREVATVGIFTDLRDRVRLERKLSDVESRLEESERNAVIVALAGTAAHELNQPLTSVMGYAELLKRKLPKGDPSERAIDIIYREGERMAEIVKKIGKITRYETKAYIGASRILDLDKASSNEE